MLAAICLCQERQQTLRVTGDWLRLLWLTIVRGGRATHLENPNIDSALCVEGRCGDLVLEEDEQEEEEEQQDEKRRSAGSAASEMEMALCG